MKVVAALIVAIAASGCSLIDGLSGEGEGGEGRIRASWSLKMGSQTVGCSPDAPVVEVFSTNSVDAFSDTYDCTDGDGTTAKLPANPYGVRLFLLDPAADPPGSRLLEAEEMRNADVTDGAVDDVGMFTFQVGLSASP